MGKSVKNKSTDLDLDLDLDFDFELDYVDSEDKRIDKKLEVQRARKKAQAERDKVLAEFSGSFDD